MARRRLIFVFIGVGLALIIFGAVGLMRNAHSDRPHLNFRPVPPLPERYVFSSTTTSTSAPSVP